MHPLYTLPPLLVPHAFAVITVTHTHTHPPSLVWVMFTLNFCVARQPVSLSGEAQKVEFGQGYKDHQLGTKDWVQSPGDRAQGRETLKP